MKKFLKTCLILSGVLLALGVVCYDIGIALGSSPKDVWAMAENGDLNVGHWHIGRWALYWSDDTDSEDEEMEEDDAYGRAGDGTETLGTDPDRSDGNVIEYGKVDKSFPSSDVDTLKVNFQYGTMHITDSDDDTITVSIDAPKKNSYRCEIKDGTLTVKDKTKGYKWNSGEKQVTATIAIPKGKTFKKAVIHTDAGKITMDHELTAEDMQLDIDAGELMADVVRADKKLDMEVGAGHMKVDSFTAGKVTLDCGVGQLELTGTANRDVEADCGIGQIAMTLTGQEDSYDYDLSCGLGEIRINGKSYSSLGDDKEIDNGADREIALDCGVGQIDLNVKED